MKYALIVTGILTCTITTGQINYLDYDSDSDRIISFENLDSTSYLTGYFDSHDTELDTCYAVKNENGETGLYFQYGDGTSSSIAAGNTWTAMIPIEKNTFDFQTLPMLQFSYFCVYTKSEIASAESYPDTSPSTAVLIKSVLKSYKIKCATHVIYLRAETTNHIIFRYQGEWLFVGLSEY
jgi:hypothetical protein